MKIDFRLKNQRIGNIYIWKLKEGFGVGINGTSHHYKVSTKEEVRLKANELKNKNL